VAESGGGRPPRMTSGVAFERFQSNRKQRADRRIQFTPAGALSLCVRIASPREPNAERAGSPLSGGSQERRLIGIVVGV
jgi:hypothetical protein